MFDLFLFHTNFEFDLECIKHGVSGLIVDLETNNKCFRQKDYDTQINKHTINDIIQIKSLSKSQVICRINSVNKNTVDELYNVINAGADEILIPMVRTLDEIEWVLELVNKKCLVSVMIETIDAIKIANKINQYPLKRVYVGLTDLWIERKTAHIFSAITDGTLEIVRKSITDIPFGFGGLTLPNRGYPLLAKHLFYELARLNCDFSFLRRSFVSDVKSHNVESGIKSISEMMQKARLRNMQSIKSDYDAARKAINSLVE